MLGDLFERADTIWSSLLPSDRLEAFAAEKRDGHEGIESFAENDRAQFDELDSLYENKFGFIFIVNTSGKRSGEILAICRARLGNSVETELAIASHEFRGIMETRLARLIER